ncbi:MAG: rhomboid family intramembrane serine protease [Deltaproteobacteria bacterium]|nr:rhomboid family intramembrane serine protease [Deltaproteobacteria bacterium]
MLLVPIGHDDLSVRRLPWITIGIALLSIVIQVEGCVVEQRTSAQQEVAVKALEQLLMAVVLRCAQPNVGLDIGDVGAAANNVNKTSNNADDEDNDARQTCPPGIIEDPHRVVESLGEGTVGTPEQQARFRALKEELKNIAAQHPIAQLGYRPKSDGLLAMLTYMFAHGGWMHLIGNMFFLYLAGTTIEDHWGRWRFLLLYLAGGIVAAFAYRLMNPGSDVPLVGASGAIATAMGAFFVQFARTPIKFFYAIWFFVFRAGTFSAPAWVVLPLWLAQQLVSLSAEAADGVGYSAHAGGFLFGAAIAGGVRLLGWDRHFDEEVERAAGGWSEDPRYLESVAQRDAQDYAAALRTVSAFLRQSPGHLKAKELAFELACEVGDASIINKLAPTVLPRWAKDDPQRALSIYLRWDATFPPMDERLLVAVLTAAAKLGNLDVAQEIAGRFFREFKKSRSTPRVLWMMTELYANEERFETAAKFAGKLVGEHPHDAFAHQAETWLSEHAERLKHAQGEHSL